MRKDIREKLNETANLMTTEKWIEFEVAQEYFERDGNIDNYIDKCIKNDIDDTSSTCDELYELFDINEEDNEEEYELIKYTIKDRYIQILNEYKTNFDLNNQKKKKQSKKYEYTNLISINCTKPKKFYQSNF
jgi:hypothetical protein